MDLYDPIKVLIVSDTHGVFVNDLQSAESKIKYCDLAFSLGDVNLENLVYLKSIFEDRVFGVLGNHDPYFYLEKAGLQNISNSLLEINNIKFTGFSGVWKYKETGQYPLFLSHEESIEISNRLPKSEILLSHDTAFGIYKKSKNHPGLKGISKYILEGSPSINFHGYHHSNKMDQLGGTSIIGIHSVAIIELAKDKTNQKIKILSHELLF